jgi:hypothetical protein
MRSLWQDEGDGRRRRLVRGNRRCKAKVTNQPSGSKDPADPQTMRVRQDANGKAKTIDVSEVLEKNEIGAFQVGIFILCGFA